MRRSVEWRSATENRIPLCGSASRSTPASSRSPTNTTMARIASRTSARRSWRGRAGWTSAPGGEGGAACVLTGPLELEVDEVRARERPEQRDAPDHQRREREPHAAHAAQPRDELVAERHRL